MTDRSTRIPVRLIKWTDELDSKRVRFSFREPDAGGQGLFSVERISEGWWSVAIVTQTSAALITHHLSQAEADSIRKVEGSVSDFSVNSPIR